jgi:hypothetical protein
MMKAISLWQPYATALVRGWKLFETRGWPMPEALIGVPIALAATKQIKGEQRKCFNAPRFQRVWRKFPLVNVPLEDLPRGCVLGTVVFEASRKIDYEWTVAVEEREFQLGDWQSGRWAWPVSNIAAFQEPVACRGGQGIWHWHG